MSIHRRMRPSGVGEHSGDFMTSLSRVFLGVDGLHRNSLDWLGALKQNTSGVFQTSLSAEPPFISFEAMAAHCGSNLVAKDAPNRLAAG
jgi:hypothetical protein